MKRNLIIFSAILSFSIAAAHADIVTGYVNDPTTDSTEFTNGLVGLGSSLITLDVSTLSTGALNPSAFADVTLTGTGAFSTVLFGAGPGQGNVTSTPLSTGEGPHPAANFIGDDATGSGTLTVSFNTATSGAGLFLIDLFNPCTGCDDVTIEAFTGTGGTGTSLGVFHAAEDNFQANNLYFMGITSSGGDIGSIVLTQPSNPTGDIIGLGDILYGTTAMSSVPEPTSILAVPAILIAIGLLVRRGKYPVL